MLLLLIAFRNTILYLQLCSMKKQPIYLITFVLPSKSCGELLSRRTHMHHNQTNNVVMRSCYTSLGALPASFVKRHIPSFHPIKSVKHRHSLM